MKRRTNLDRALSIFAPVEGGEGITALLLTTESVSADDGVLPDQFAIIGIGSSLGAILGAGAASRLFAAIGGYAILLVAAALLGIRMVLTNVVHRREQTRSGPRPCNEPLKFNGGFQLVFKQRYLLLIALLMIFRMWSTRPGIHSQRVCLAACRRLPCVVR